MGKKTFTYATDPKVKEKADRKAKREKITLSEAIDRLLRDYIAVDKVKLKIFQEKAEKWDNLGQRIGKFYEEDAYGDLGDIGEAAANAYGYL